MSSQINVIDSAGNPQALTGDDVAKLLGIDLKQLSTAWGNFDGLGSATINDSFKIASIVRSGTGTYAVTLSVPMDNANYAITLGGLRDATNAGKVLYDNVTVNGFDIETFDEANAKTDFTNVSFSIIGGKA